jgi:hypothetical protein
VIIGVIVFLIRRQTLADDAKIYRERRHIFVDTMNQDMGKGRLVQPLGLEGEDDEGLVLHMSDCNMSELRHLTTARGMAEMLEKSDFAWMRCDGQYQKLEPPWR